MNALNINFVQRRRLASTLGWLLLVMGLVAVGTIGGDYLDARDELARVEQRQARLQRPAANPARRAASAPEVRNDTQAVERVKAQLHLPWDTVLREVESATSPAIALLDLEAKGQTRVLRLTGEAKTMTDVVAYVSRLRQSRWIEAANLSHHEEKQAASVKVIRFSVDATWRAPS